MGLTIDVVGGGAPPVAGAGSTGGFMSSLGSLGGFMSSAGSFMGGLSALGGLFGSSAPSAKRMIARAENEMRFQRDITRDLRSTAYGDTVNSLKAAGLNPMLAYTNGVAQGGSVSYPNIHNTSAENAGADLSRMQKAASAAQIANIMADTQKKFSEKNLTDKITLKTETDTKIGEFQVYINDLRKQYQDIGTALKAVNEADIAGANLDKMKAQIGHGAQEELLDLALKHGFKTWEAALQDVQFRNILLGMKAQEQGIDLTALQFPGAKNEAAYQDAIGSAGQYSSGAQSAIRLLQGLQDLFGTKPSRSINIYNPAPR